MTIFRWQNCYADVATAMHGISVQSFLDDVIVPSIQALEEKMHILSRSDEPITALALSDTGDMLRETKMAFALSIQSIWERQLRGYLRGCASALRPHKGLEEKAEKANWRRLRELFIELRDIELEAFPSFSELDKLHLLGNACRHGDGPSATELARHCPELWPDYLLPPADANQVTAVAPSVELMDIPLDRLRLFCAAIVTFWGDAEYIYNESIECKHPSLEARLAQERTQRSWQPVAGMRRLRR
ncbi:hypothetical protein [Halomonas dongshanensis]|uniref:DUF4145 domain-containing protein n=1 Tax=Halomonas dongshanensis TaxID=2890835 RepID=A0ABT2EHF1_9GAMM|nr:hypothetical protein [Halomonas dongshanensis]MCS2611006.1 hypothetical protein [Halomonas dongshanensis]